MSVMLRVLLIVFSLASGLSVIRRVRRAKLQIEDAVFWVGMSFLLICLAVFPRIVYFLSELTGTQSPANLIYLVIIFILIMKIFSMSLHISNIEEKLNKLAQNAALEAHRDRKGGKEVE